MEEKMISFRLSSAEYEALKKLAKMEVRSVSGWLKFRVVDAIRAAMMSTEETSQENTALSMEGNKDREVSSHVERK